MWRILRTIVENLLLYTMYSAPSSGVKEIKVTKKWVLDATGKKENRQ